ncbi:metalloregulator ArsR/SmtB family transcription factor [Candidatus Parcubacteria bacterium]|nr:metalloregulator ArsR/SmtB family transcription factor [Candidatus Parcubacteria bacterium]
MSLIKNKPLKLSSREDKIVSTLQVLGDKTRFKMFKILTSGREMCVSEIAAELNISTPAVSQHFRIFELVGLVEKQRYGHKICYALKNDDQLIKEFKAIFKEGET